MPFYHYTPRGDLKPGDIIEPYQTIRKAQDPWLGFVHKYYDQNIPGNDVDNLVYMTNKLDDIYAERGHCYEVEPKQCLPNCFTDVSPQIVALDGDAMFDSLQVGEYGAMDKETFVMMASLAYCCDTMAIDTLKQYGFEIDEGARESIGIDVKVIAEIDPYTGQKISSNKEKNMERDAFMAGYEAGRKYAVNYYHTDSRALISEEDLYAFIVGGMLSFVSGDYGDMSLEEARDENIAYFTDLCEKAYDEIRSGEAKSIYDK